MSLLHDNLAYRKVKPVSVGDWILVGASVVEPELLFVQVAVTGGYIDVSGR
jgi:hypothetical protein